MDTKEDLSEFDNDWVIVEPLPIITKTIGKKLPALTTNQSKQLYAIDNRGDLIKFLKNNVEERTEILRQLLDPEDAELGRFFWDKPMNEKLLSDTVWATNDIDLRTATLQKIFLTNNNKPNRLSETFSERALKFYERDYREPLIKEHNNLRTTHSIIKPKSPTNPDNFTPV